MTKIESISFFLNCDLARERANQIGKIASAAANAGSLDSLVKQIAEINAQYWKLECSIEEVARKNMAVAEAEFQREAAMADAMEGV